ncbi:MAG: hypothetical protein LBV71_20415 [Prevotella sp.]|jgi:hypothetical protein|nr:hypothetical protein [Prevotella sp.]
MAKYKKTSFIGLLILISIYMLISVSLNKCVENRQKGAEYRGVLNEVFRDENNRYTHTYKIQTDNGIINQVVISYSKSLDYVEIGDSIITEKGKLEIIIRKKSSNYNTYAVFPYE